MSAFESIIHFLTERNLQLVTAESCTAGLVTSMVANVPGCGAVMEMGFVVYSERAKNLCLGVSLQTIKTFGLTSEEVAREMAAGALDRSHADLAIAITGTAESNDELNGVVCFAYALRGQTETKLHSQTIHFAGERNEVRNRAAEHALLYIPAAYQLLLDQPD